MDTANQPSGNNSEIFSRVKVDESIPSVLGDADVLDPPAVSLEERYQTSGLKNQITKI
jgi:hypothetical protein